MDFRQYDNATGRFNCIDLLAETSMEMTPYHFGRCNPNYWADPSGLDVIDNEDGTHFTGDDAALFFQAYNAVMYGGATQAQFSMVGTFNMGGGSPFNYFGNMAGYEFGNSYYGDGGIYYAYINGEHVAYRQRAMNIVYYNVQTGVTQYFLLENSWVKVAQSHGIDNLYGTTYSFKEGHEHKWSSGIGDEIINSNYGGIVNGKEGSLYNKDTSLTHRKLDSVSYTIGGILTIGFNTDVSISIGLGYNGNESHFGIGIGNGLGQISYGSSITKNGSITGHDTTIKAGAGILGAAVLTYFTGASAILAF
jgi:hypothetical protein